MAAKIRIEKDVELYYEDYGQGDTVIFIPGLTFTTEFFAHNLETLAAGNRIIAYDPRSQGKSTISKEGNNFAQRSRDLAALVDGLDDDAPALEPIQHFG